MARVFVWLSIFALIASCGGSPAVRVYFQPGGGASGRVASEIAAARRDVRVAIYAFTREEIRDALIDAHRRGVTVRVKMDRRNAEHERSAWRALRAAGVHVELHTAEGSLHHKYCVIDGRRVVTGSYNWLDSAELRNHENLLVIEDPSVARAFAADWDRVPSAE